MQFTKIKHTHAWLMDLSVYDLYIWYIAKEFLPLVRCVITFSFYFFQSFDSRASLCSKYLRSRVELNGLVIVGQRSWVDWFLFELRMVMLNPEQIEEHKAHKLTFRPQVSTSTALPSNIALRVCSTWCVKLSSSLCSYFMSVYCFSHPQWHPQPLYLYFVLFSG